MANITNPAAEYLINLNNAAPDTYLEIPDLLIEQIQKGATKFKLGAEQVADVSYSGKTVTNTDFFRIEIHDASTNEDGSSVKFKVRLRGILDIDTGEMRLMKAGQTMSESEMWLHGFNSTFVELNTESVEDGLVSQEDFDALVKYALWWEALVAEQGPRAPYTKAYARTRLYVAAANENFEFLFDLEDRGNPNDESALVVGINNIEWVNAHFTSRTPGTMVGTIGKAKGVEMAGKVKLPTPSRRVSLTSVEEVPVAERRGTK